MLSLVLVGVLWLTGKVRGTIAVRDNVRRMMQGDAVGGTGRRRLHCEAEIGDRKRDHGGGRMHRTGLSELSC